MLKVGLHLVRDILFILQQGVSFEIWNKISLSTASEYSKPKVHHGDVHMVHNKGCILSLCCSMSK